MDEEIVVTAEGTAPEATPDQTAADTASPDTGTPSDGTLNREDGHAKGARAQERITDLVRERNELRRELEAARASREAPARNQPPQLDGVTDEGIDPARYAESLLRNARTEAQRAVAFEVQHLEAMKDPAMKGEYAQLQVSSLIDRGYSPLEALDAYKEQMAEIEKETDRKRRERDEAGRFARDASGISPAGKASALPGSFTNAQIDAMSLDEYRQNEKEIKRQQAAGLIK